WRSSYFGTAAAIRIRVAKQEQVEAVREWHGIHADSKCDSGWGARATESVCLTGTVDGHISVAGQVVTSEYGAVRLVWVGMHGAGRHVAVVSADPDFDDEEHFRRLMDSIKFV